MIKTDYIDVSVTLPLDQTFVYKVPPHLREQCVPGMRVLVPFGRRRVTGYILGEQESCGPYKAKNILDVLDDHPLFPMGEIAFFKWVAQYYIHPLGEVIKTALPSGLDRQDISCVFVTETGMKDFSAGNLAPGEAGVIQFLKEKEGCTLKQLIKNSPNPSIQALVRKMEKNDLLMVSAVLKKDVANIKKEKVIQHLGEIPKKNIRLSHKRQQILAIVREKQEISLASLKVHVPTAANLIGPLADAGYIGIIRRQVFRDPLGDPVEPDTPPTLTDEQTTLIETVRENSQKGFVPYLLTGVTGSGKTEVYMRLVADAVQSGRTAIVLVPEIALISQTERRFRARFGEKIAVIHSMLTHGERLDQWRKLALGKVSIVIGARSAIFSPIEDIGVIIVDEEHDTSYKQETGLRYNARDLAVVRAKMHDCPVILGSATPSVQSYQNVRDNKFVQLTLEKRVNQNPLPEITLIDLKKYKDFRGTERIISPELAIQIRACLEKGNQALIFLNRRGFATFPACKDCGESLKCRFCDVTMTFHRGQETYKCHLCGHTLPVKVSCPECKGKKIHNFGFGTEKIETMLKSMFPDARLTRIDQDSTSKKGSVLKLLKSIRNRTVDIIVGTQMLAKGHDFPSITLVGVICADLSLSLPDFRAGERTFQLLAQVAGRAGRGKEPGRVIMQTYNPEHFSIEAARRQDYTQFFNHEAPFRKALMYPPFTRMIQLKISGKDEKKVALHVDQVAGVLRSLLASNPEIGESVQILGPIEAAIYRISSRFRWQILIKSSSASHISRLVKSMKAHPGIKAMKQVTIAVDVDPYSLT
ncbi:MAG: primosomal protein N' [Desulfobacteraceae bacterium]|nr:primosomal protein N' [Desulfobacteraceae bacterium]